MKKITLLLGAILLSANSFAINPDKKTVSNKNFIKKSEKIRCFVCVFSDTDGHLIGCVPIGCGPNV